MRMILPRSLLLALLAAPLAVAQTEQSPIKIPANGGTNLRELPQLGEAIAGALRAHVERNPMQPYLGNTFTCTVPGLWECHVWFEADGSGALFHARRHPDGSVTLGSAAFTYRLAGKPGNYQLCFTLTGNVEETCRGRWAEGHALYDEWFSNHDQPAEGQSPAYRNVLEQFAIIAGHR